MCCRSLLGLVLAASSVLGVTDGQASSHFVLNGVHYPNGSTVLRTDIGEGNAALMCTTDRVNCCRIERAGHFYFPNGTLVPTLGTEPADRTYYRNRDAGFIRLNRLPNGNETGWFHCEIPYTNGTLVNLTINVVDPPPVITVSITASGTNTAGETYSLACSATVTWSTDQPTITWLGPMNKTVPSENVTTTGSMSTLTFDPLAASHAGTYTCRATISGNVTDTDTKIVSVENPSISVSIPVQVPVPVVGSAYSLNCTITEAERLTDSIIAYQWFKDGEVVSDQTMQTLSFPSLSFSDAGDSYTCQATVMFSLLSRPILTNSSNTVVVYLTLPTPRVTINSRSSTITVRSAITLTCTVELSPAVDVPVTVNTVFTGPAHFMNSTTAQLVIGSTTTYTSTAMVSSFGREQSGLYKCTATISSTSSFVTSSMASASIRVTVVGVYLSLKGMVYPNNSRIVITDIGQTNNSVLPPLNSNNGLQCITDKRPCCRGDYRAGDWFFPDNGGMVSIQTGATTFYRNRGYDGTVNLNRVNNDVMMPTGRFCCVVSDATPTEVTVCANIVQELPSTTFTPGLPANPTTPLSGPTPPSSPTPTNGRQSSGSGAGAAAAGVVVALLVIALIIVAVVVIVVIFMRRRSDKPTFIKSHSTPSVGYSNIHNGDKVTGVGRKLNVRILKFPSDTNITEGEGVYFKIKVSGVPQPTVTWYHDGEPVTTDYAREIEADGSLAIPSAELKHSGAYKAVVANQHGSEERELKLTVNEEGGASTAIPIGDIVSTRPIPIPMFGNYVAELHANSNQPFEDLYLVLDSGAVGHTMFYALDPKRKPLNRFGNIVAYDDTRIPLKPIPDVPECQHDYINASYVDGYSLHNKFIATQGPLPKTVVDFWRLIWQEHPPTIVMVTNVKEGNRIKCQQYWPDSGKAQYGPFQVTITDQQVFADYTIRTLSVSLGFGHSHKVTQFHFTAWPDHGVPDYATPILAFHRRVKAQHHPSRGPMVVHCSAGVGRTGTLIVIDNILEQIEKEQVVDIPGAITKIRRSRMRMVQTPEQFIFIHDAILESVTCGDTQIAATNLRAAIAKMKKKDPLNQQDIFQHQFTVLEQVSLKPDQVVCSYARTFPERNRGDLFLPANRCRVVLKGEQPDYIHAVSANGYKQKKAFIIAQGPMESTVRNFWKMIYDRKCAVVVMVSGLVERNVESCAHYWPSSGTFLYGEYTVEMLSEEPLEGFTIREFSVVNNYQYGKAHRVTQFHITCWTPDGHCSNLNSVTDVIEEMTKVQIRSGNKPIVVHCNDTVTRSGMFCAIATTIERCKTEGVVDVFQVVKALRIQKPGAVPTVVHYKLIFDAIMTFLESFDTYANFQNI